MDELAERLDPAFPAASGAVGQLEGPPDAIAETGLIGDDNFHFFSAEMQCIILSEQSAFVNPKYRKYLDLEVFRDD
jgi:hypothetical protein